MRGRCGRQWGLRERLASGAGGACSGQASRSRRLLAFTAYFLASKRLRTRVGAFEYVCGFTTVAAVVVGLACLMHGERLGTPRAADWALLAGIAFLPGTLGHVLVNWAHPHAPAVIVSVMLLGVPVLAIAGAAAVLGEHVTALQAAGGAAVLVAVGRLVLAPPREDLAEGAAQADAP